MHTAFDAGMSAAERGAARWHMLSLLAGAVLVVAIVGFLLYPRPVSEPEAPEAPAEAPPAMPGTPIEPVAPARSKDDRGDSAREIIAALRAGEGPVDYARAHERARAFHAAGRLADAQLLYFFAARGGHAPAALELATMYDPNHYSAESSLMDEPDPFQAHKWYRQARRGGNETAGERLARLRRWAEEAARAGDTQAERLLLQWDDSAAR